MPVIASVRSDVANYVGALFEVYIVLIFGYILLNLLFSFGLRPGYRPTHVLRPREPSH